MQLRASMKSPQNALRLDHDLRKLLQRPSTSQFLRIVNDHFDAKHALAVGIDLQRQLAAVQLEYRQIIRRFLDRYFPFGRLLFPLSVLRAALVAQDGPDRLQVQQHAAADKVSAIFARPAASEI